MSDIVFKVFISWICGSCLFLAARGSRGIDWKTARKESPIVVGLLYILLGVLATIWGWILIT